MDMTRAHMERILAEGGSILHKGMHLTHISQLPSEADLAVGNAEATAAALAGIAKQRAALDAQEFALLSASGASSSPAPARPAVPAKKPLPLPLDASVKG